VLPESKCSLTSYRIFGVHNVVYKRQAWGIAPCFYLPSRSNSTRKKHSFWSIVLCPRALYVARPVCEIALLINHPVLGNAGIKPHKVNVSELDYSFLTISIHFSVEKDLGL
jgi:hypothetical protein